MFVRMLKLPDDVRTKYDTSTLKGAVHAAAPCPADVKAKMIDWWGPILIEYYAGSEGNGVTVSDSKQWLAHRQHVGLVEGAAQGRAAVTAGTETYALCRLTWVRREREVGLAQLADIGEKILRSGFAGQWMDRHGFALLVKVGRGITREKTSSAA